MFNNTSSTIFVSTTASNNSNTDSTVFVVNTTTNVTTTNPDAITTIFGTTTAATTTTTTTKLAEDTTIILFSTIMGVASFIVIIMLVTFCCFRRKQNHDKAGTGPHDGKSSGSSTSETRSKQESQTSIMEKTKESNAFKLPNKITNRGADLNSYEHNPKLPSKLQREPDENIKIEKNLAEKSINKSFPIAPKVTKHEHQHNKHEKLPGSFETSVRKPDGKIDITTGSQMAKAHTKPKALPVREKTKRFKKLPQKRKVIPAYIDVRHIRFFKGPLEPTPSEHTQKSIPSAKNISLPPLIEGADDKIMPSSIARPDVSIRAKRTVPENLAQAKSCDKSILKTSVRSSKSAATSADKAENRSPSDKDKAVQVIKSKEID